MCPFIGQVRRLEKDSSKTRHGNEIDDDKDSKGKIKSQTESTQMKLLFMSLHPRHPPTQIHAILFADSFALLSFMLQREIERMSLTSRQIKFG
jgi:hypothetical protein